jgi:ABC-2 type transport system permease protein
MRDQIVIAARHVGIIFRKEIGTYFNSPVAYITLVVFLLISGWFFSSSFFLINESDLRGLFNIIPVIYLFFVPAITMGLIAREKSAGTMELLVTLPLEDWEVVLGKYLAAVVLIVVGLLYSLFHFFTLTFVGTNIDLGAIFTAYLGLLLVGGVYAAAGVFCSAVTGNQITSFILAFLIVFAFFMMDKVLFFIPSFLAGIIQYISIDYHLSNISRGVIDSRNLIYFGTVIAAFLIMAVRVLEIRKWR